MAVAFRPGHTGCAWMTGAVTTGGGGAGIGELQAASTVAIALAIRREERDDALAVLSGDAVCMEVDPLRAALDGSATDG